MKYYNINAQSNKSNRNLIEGMLCKRLLDTFASLDYDLNDIAIITPYREQEKYLRDSMDGFNNIYTIDKAQGMEKNVIIFSLAKTLADDTLLLKAKPRINVAFTRSKVKLILIGLYDIIVQIDVIKNFLAKIKLEGRFVELAEDIVL
jgi:DNA replication ATP-dependent helicase Dna2